MDRQGMLEGMMSYLSKARSRLRPGRLAALTSVCLVGMGGALAAAAWSSSGSGQSAAATYALPAGPQPTTLLSGDAVALSWAPVSLPGGEDVEGYEVNRVDADTGAVGAVGGDCAGIVTTTTCTDPAVPGGDWTYTVTPVQFSWTGAAGPGATVLVAIPTSTDPTSTDPTSTEPTGTEPT